MDYLLTITAHTLVYTYFELYFTFFLPYTVIEVVATL